MKKLTLFFGKQIIKKNIIPFTLVLFFNFILLACQQDKKKELSDLKTQLKSIQNKIDLLENELNIDSDSLGKISKLPLVGIDTVTKQIFRHYIDLYGTVFNDNDFIVTPKLGPGQITNIFVKKGDKVTAGQKLLQLDNKILNEQILTTQKNIDGIKSQLDFAKDVYQKQQNLYNQKIGSEFQYLTAKNNVTQLENNLLITQQQLETQKTQLDFYTVRSEVNGTVEEMNAKVGGTFSGYNPNGTAQIRIINDTKLILKANVPEDYINVVKVGKIITLNQEFQNQTLYTKIKTVGDVINDISRSFYIEADLPEPDKFRPNELVPIHIQDVVIEEAIVLPLNAIQKDENENFVFKIVIDNGQFIVKKNPIKIGLIYKDKIVVTEGLNKNELIVTAGFSSLFDGQQVKIR